MLLPRSDEHGPYISYSQIKLWNELKGYNTGLSGKKEFIRSYFLGEQYPDKGGYGQFGTEVEAYITDRKEADKFTDAERAVLEQVVPLGVFQREFKCPFEEGFYVKGFIDDCSEDLTRIRDYKTASLNSSKKYYEDDYFQLDVYALAIDKEIGKIPTDLEVTCIERTGNGFRGGRGVLNVGSTIWHIPRKTSVERLKTLSNTIISTAVEISEYYQIFLELNT